MVAKDSHAAEIPSVKKSVEGIVARRPQSWQPRTPTAHPRNPRGQSADHRPYRNILRDSFNFGLGTIGVEGAPLSGQPLSSPVSRGARRLNRALYGCRWNEANQDHISGSA